MARDLTRTWFCRPLVARLQQFTEPADIEMA